jgi:hypothetical protein
MKTPMECHIGSFSSDPLREQRGTRRLFLVTLRARASNDKPRPWMAGAFVCLEGL